MPKSAKISLLVGILFLVLTVVNSFLANNKASPKNITRKEVKKPTLGH